MRCSFIKVVLLLLSSLNAIAQSNTMVTLLDNQLQPASKKEAVFVSKLWQEADVWHEKIYSFLDDTFYQENFYKDQQRTIKQGISLTYYAGGKLKDSGRFENNLQQGIFRSWHEDGKKASMIKYNSGVVIDTSLWWDNEGHINRTIYADKAGNGTLTEYWSSGKTKIIGKLVAGKNEGAYDAFQENGTKAMQLQYKGDSLISTTCIDAQGKPMPGNCIYEKPAEFRGGANAWKRFLEQNVEYPKYAQKKSIQGVVKVQFIVSKTGEVSEFKIISSPDESLSKEVLRLMSLSPLWKPAIQMNKAVTYRHIQSITFQLK